ncbi:MAG TPA: TldD/PmbA family protein [Methanosarcinaceae archaeon]|nr:TldD/PmbA family protein [Methanosarcinaceae archaeon]
MYDLAQKALAFAMKNGADEAEVYYANSRSTSANIRKNMVEGANEQFSEGIGIRAIIGGAVGFASTNMPDRLEDAVKIAVDSARVRESDPDWTGLVSNAKYPDVSGTFDKKIVAMELYECIELTLQMIEGARSAPKSNILATSGSFSRSYSKHLILNSNGVEVEEEGTSTSGFIDVITTKGDTATAYDFEVSRNHDIDFHKIGVNAAKLAQGSQNGISIEPHKTDVILHPFAFSDIIESAFAPSIDADNMQKGRSSLIGRIGEEIAASELTIIDDGLMPGGIETGISDDEGVPSQQTSVIENGVFKSYLFDSYTAGKDGVKSTGNAARQSYVSTPSVGLRNFIIEYPQSDIISETDSGVFVNTVIGAHTANAISGDFSVEARNAYTIKDGQVDKPIRSLMISGNIFEMLANISGAGMDVRKVGGTVTPSIRVSDMSVVG